MALKGHNRNLKDVQDRLQIARKTYAAGGIANMRYAAALIEGQSKVLAHIAAAISDDCDSAETIIRSFESEGIIDAT